MAQTLETYVSDGSQTIYTFGFEYLQKSFVKVFVDGLEVGFTLSGTYQVTLDAAPAAGAVIVVRRVTDTVRLVDFVDGSVLVAKDLNVSAMQATHIAAEALDVAAGSLLINEAGDYTAGFRKIADLGDPTEPRDAVNKQWVETDANSSVVQARAARDAAQSAESSTLTLKQQATNARNAAQDAQAGAENAYANLQTDLNAATNTAVAQATSDAEAARDTANSHKNAAQTAQTAAEAARDTANSHKNTANTYKNTAKTYRDDAEGFKNTANSAASAASGSASAAAQSAADAAVSASSIDTSSFLTNSGAQSLVGRMFVTRVNNDGHLTFIRENGGTELARASMTLHNPSYTLQFHEGDGPAAGGSMLARFDRASDGTALPNTKSIVTREKGDVRYRNKQDDFTLLCDYTASRKYQGTIILSEALTNFDEIIVDMGHFSLDPALQCPHVIPTQLAVPGTKFEVSTNNAIQRYTVNTSTKFTIDYENSSWVRKVWGRNRR